MVVRVKEVVIRYEDDGELSPLSKDEHKEKYSPMRMEIHHHCSPPKMKKEGASDRQEEIDLKKTLKLDMDDVESVPAR